MEDARTLLSTSFHEGIIHVSQAPNNWAPMSRPAAQAVNELEAFQSERAISARLGLNQRQIAVINGKIQEYSAMIRGTEYQSRVAQGNFRLFPSDVMTGP
jgi:hypothetical protein